MGLASANWEASCRTWGGTSGGAKVAKVKYQAFPESAILVICTPYPGRS